MKDALINTALFIIAIITIVGATWYVSPNGSIDREKEFEDLSQREVIDSVLIEDIFGSFVAYSYIGDPLPEKLVEDEVVSMRTESSFTELIDVLNEGTKEEEFILDLVAYSQKTFINKDDTWYYIEHDETPKDVFDKVNKKLSYSILGNIAYADTFYTEAGDGYVSGGSVTSWTEVHDLTIGSGVNYTNTTAVVWTQATEGGKGPDSWSIYRVFLPFDTSSIPSGSTIDSGTLSVYVTATSDMDNDGVDYITVIRTSQPTHSSLTADDYNNAGATNNPTEGVATSQRKDITSISTSAYLAFTLNSTGLGWVAISGEASNCSSTNGISCFGIREGHDTTDAAIILPASGANTNSVTISTSENTGTTQDPKLVVTYTTPTVFAPWLFHEF